MMKITHDSKAKDKRKNGVVKNKTSTVKEKENIPLKIKHKSRNKIS